MATKTMAIPRPRGYEPLDSDGNEIRVVKITPAMSTEPYSQYLTISCYTEIVKFNSGNNSFTPYRALSYTWGEPTNSTPIFLDGRVVHVTENLAGALQYLATSHPESKFWIDAICIDQANELEKSKQVAIMGNIFKRATEVMVWLGPSEEGSAEAMKALRQIGEACQNTLECNNKGRSKLELAQSTKNIEDTDEKSFLHKIESEWFLEDKPLFDPLCISRLFQRPWFRRVWVLQEATVNTNVTFHCGDEKITKRALWAGARAITALTNSVCHKTSARGVNDPLWQTLSGANFILRRTMDLVRKNVGEYTLEQLLLETSANLGEWSYEASEARDRIYAIMGLSSDVSKLGIQPNYDRLCKDVYADTAERILTGSGTIDILYTVRWPKNVQPMPSWVPDWSTSIPASFGLRQMGRFSASGKASRATPLFTSDQYGNRILALRGYEVDKVKTILRQRHYPPIGSASAREIAVREVVKLFHELSLLETAAYGNLDSRHEALWRTPIADCDAVFNIKQRYRPVATVRMKESYNALMTLSSKDACCDLRARAYLRVMKLVSAQRRLFVSEKGYMGLGADTMRTGDTICLLLGGDSPLILRGTESGYHELVGEAYVHGIMHGEFLSDESRLKEFRLC